MGPAEEANAAHISRVSPFFFSLLVVAIIHLFILLLFRVRGFLAQCVDTHVAQRARSQARE